MSLKLMMLTGAAAACMSAAALAQAPDMHVVGPSSTRSEPESKKEKKADKKAEATKDAAGVAEANVAADADVAAETAQPVAPQSASPGQAGTTPGQAQTAPGQASELTPAVTGVTPSGQATAQGQDAQATAKADVKADVRAGASVFDAQGNSVGKIESVDGKDAVLNTGKVQVKIPLKSLAQNDKGLAIGMTKSEIEAAAKKQ